MILQIPSKLRQLEILTETLGKTATRQELQFQKSQGDLQRIMIENVMLQPSTNYS